MKPFAAISVLLIVVNSVMSENVQIKPIAVDNKSLGKNDPIPEYYQGSRQGFMPSNIMDSYGGYNINNNNFDSKFGSTLLEKVGMNKYLIDYNNRERLGASE